MHRMAKRKSPLMIQNPKETNLKPRPKTRPPKGKNRKKVPVVKVKL